MSDNVIRVEIAAEAGEAPSSSSNAPVQPPPSQRLMQEVEANDRRRLEQRGRTQQLEADFDRRQAELRRQQAERWAQAKADAGKLTLPPAQAVAPPPRQPPGVPPPAAAGDFPEYPEYRQLRNAADRGGTLDPGQQARLAELEGKLRQVAGAPSASVPADYHEQERRRLRDIHTTAPVPQTAAGGMQFPDDPAQRKKYEEADQRRAEEHQRRMAEHDARARQRRAAAERADPGYTLVEDERRGGKLSPNANRRGGMMNDPARSALLGGAMTASAVARNASRLDTGGTADTLAAGLGQAGGALGGFTGAALQAGGSLVRSTKGVTDGFDGLARRLGGYSGQVATATAQADVRQVLGDVRRAREIAPELSAFTTQASITSQVAQDELLKIARLLLPIATDVMRHLERILRGMDRAFSDLNGYAESIDKATGGALEHLAGIDSGTASQRRAEKERQDREAAGVMLEHLFASLGNDPFRDQQFKALWEKAGKP